MATYRQLVAVKITTRDAASLTGVARASAARKARPAIDPEPRAAIVPANKLSLAERTRVLDVLDSAEFVDQPPLQVYALKCLYLVTRSLDPKGTGQTRWTMRWKPALNAFAITFGDRMPKAENH